MFIAGLGTATPPNRYTQAECWDALVASAYLPRLSSRSQAILRKVLRGNNGICSRYLSFDDLIEAFAMTPDVLDARFAKHAPAVAAKAAMEAMDRAELTAEPGRMARTIEWKSADTLLSADDRDELRFERRGGMLRNILSPQVPALAGKHVQQVMNTLLTRAGVGREEIHAWILHAGGREILASIRQQLGITEHDTRWSAAVLRDLGNVSSPCVYFVLDAALREQAPGGLWYMSSFGAGFSCHGALLEVGD